MRWLLGSQARAGASFIFTLDKMSDSLNHGLIGCL